MHHQSPPSLDRPFGIVSLVFPFLFRQGHIYIVVVFLFFYRSSCIFLVPDDEIGARLRVAVVIVVTGRSGGELSSLTGPHARAMNG